MEIAILCLLHRLCFSAPPTQNGKKKAVLLCFPTDNTIAKGCAGFREKLKSAGWELVEINFENSMEKDPSAITDRIREFLSKEVLPPTAPIVVHGHGMSHSLSHSIEYARDPRGQSSFISSEFLLKEIRSHAIENPLWISSCHSGCSLYQVDVCAGTSCLSEEASYARFGGEKTLDVIGELISNEKEFQKADTNHDGMLTPGEMNIYFCHWFVIGQKRLIRITARPEEKDPFRKLFRETIYLHKEQEFETKIESIKSQYTSNALAVVSVYQVHPFKIIGDGTEIQEGQLEKQLFSDNGDAEKWASKNLSGWPYSGSTTWTQTLGLSKITHRRSLQRANPPDTIVEVTTPDDSTKCKIWDEGQNFPNWVPPGWQTPEFNSFRLYSPNYLWTKPHQRDPKNALQHPASEK